MRILHFSDLHIGVENYGRIDPQTGLSTRLIDFLASLDQVVEYALTENVDLVLLATRCTNPRNMRRAATLAAHARAVSEMSPPPAQSHLFAAMLDSKSCMVFPHRLCGWLVRESE